MRYPFASYWLTVWPFIMHPIPINALEQMTPDERINTYIFINERIGDNVEHLNEFNPLFRKLFNEIFHERYNEEAQTARKIMVSRMRVPGVIHIAGFDASHADINGLDGGKTQRNRRRRNRRSLKRKHSRRR